MCLRLRLHFGPHSAGVVSRGASRQGIKARAPKSEPQILLYQALPSVLADGYPWVRLRLWPELLCRGKGNAGKRGKYIYTRAYLLQWSPTAQIPHYPDFSIFLFVLLPHTPVLPSVGNQRCPATTTKPAFSPDTHISCECRLSLSLGFALSRSEHMACAIPFWLDQRYWRQRAQSLRSADYKSRGHRKTQFIRPRQLSSAHLKSKELGVQCSTE